MNLLALRALPWKLIGFGLVVAVLGAMLLIEKGQSRHWEKKYWNAEGRVAAEAAAHRGTVANYRLASAEAQRKHDADIAAREAHYNNEGRKAKDALLGEIADLRRLAAARQLRPAIAEARTDTGGSGNNPPGGAAEAPCRVTDPSWLCLSPSDVLQAAERESRHDRLIDWVEGLSKVAPSR